MRNPKDKPAGCCETSVPQDSPVELRSPLSASTHTHTHLSRRIAPRGAISRPAHQLSWESADEFWVPFLEELHHLAEGDCRANLQKKTRCDLTTSPLRSPLAPPAPPVSPRRDLWRVRISRNLPTRRNRFLVEKLRPSKFKAGLSPTCPPNENKQGNLNSRKKVQARETAKIRHLNVRVHQVDVSLNTLRGSGISICFFPLIGEFGS